MDLSPAAAGGDTDHREAERSNKKIRCREDDPEEEARLKDPSLSYKAMLAAGHNAETIEELWEEEAEPEAEEGDIVISDGEGGPFMKLSESFKTKLRKPWENAVVIKLLGKRIGFRVLKSKIQNLWKPRSPFRLIDLENDFFIVRFKDNSDTMQALLGRPWTVFGHALMVQPWTPNFRATDGIIGKATVWVRFKGIPLDWYHSQVLLGLGDMVGSAVKIDERTTSTDRGRFAKVAVVVDLTKPLKGVITVDNEVFKVVYEGVPELCFTCGRADHTQLSCPERVRDVESTEEGLTQRYQDAPNPSEPNPASGHSRAELPVTVKQPTIGEWMVVPPRTRRQPRRFSPLNNPGNPQSRPFPGPSNRFSPLAQSPITVDQASTSTSPPQTQLNLANLVFHAKTTKSTKLQAQKNKTFLKKASTAQTPQTNIIRPPLADRTNTDQLSQPVTVIQPPRPHLNNEKAATPASHPRPSPTPEQTPSIFHNRHTAVTHTEADHSKIVAEPRTAIHDPTNVPYTSHNHRTPQAGPPIWEDPLTTTKPPDIPNSVNTDPSPHFKSREHAQGQSDVIMFSDVQMVTEVGREPPQSDGDTLMDEVTVDTHSVAQAVSAVSPLN
ncbi:hypothetical protein Tsubulata_022221 [Turnera subulata]|uniref:CCHC-type domain-containing protein n=1 Tax=Turnera subulata TaxID=218843 RepID=A0A9Q0JCG7_9ROSI|nr:hypothetical protein Tsubulata_022221 [Turnera subulata]